VVGDQQVSRKNPLGTGAGFDWRRRLAAAGAGSIRHEPHHIVAIGVVIDPRDPCRIGRGGVSKRNEDRQNARYGRREKLPMMGQVFPPALLRI